MSLTQFTRANVPGSGTVFTLPGTGPSLLELRRVNWQGDSVLYDSPRTNRFKYSEDLTSVEWGNTGVSIVSNATLAPDGSTTMDFVKENTAYDIHRIYQVLAVPTTTQKIQFFAKTSGRMMLRAYADTGISETFIRLFPGMVGAVNAAGTASTQIQELGSGFYRVCFSWDAQYPPFDSAIQLQICDDDGNAFYTGDGVSGMYFWGIEQGDAIPVSNRRIATDGDSITSGYALWPWSVRLQGNAGDVIVRHAVTGSTTGDVLTRWNTYKTDGSNWLIMMAGINDIAGGTPLVNTQNNLSSIWLDALSRGMTVVAMTVTPFKDDVYGYWTTSKQVQLELLNTWIKNFVASHTNMYLVDTYSLLVDPANPGKLLPIYASPDSLHPSALGNKVISDAVQAVVPVEDQFSSYIKTVGAAATITDYSLAGNNITLLESSTANSILWTGASTIPEDINPIWKDFASNQSFLDGQMIYANGSSRAPSIYKLNGDRNQIVPVRFMTGEMGLGDPFQMKYIRGIAAYGKGRLQVRVYVEGKPIPINKPLTDLTYGTETSFADIEMVETADPQRILWLPRGTKGRTVNIEGAGNFKHIRSLIVFWDALTGEEDG